MSGKTLRRVIQENVAMESTTLHTDSAPAYEAIGDDMAGHGAENHRVGEYVRDGMSTNKAENYFSQLKRSIDGTHHHVSKDHLGRYLSEFDFRHSTHGMTDTARVDDLMGRVAGRRLTYSDSR